MGKFIFFLLLFGAVIGSSLYLASKPLEIKKYTVEKNIKIDEDGS